MRNPIENLGDYNRLREDLQSAGGCLEALYKEIGDIAVLKETPKILLKGVLIGGGITVGAIAFSYLGYKGYCYLKERKQKIENEQAVKKDFLEAVEAAISTES